MLGLVGLLAQLVDGSLGMAYGVTSSTLLLATGIAPAAASAAVHFSEIGTSLVSGISHHKLGNVDWRTVGILAVPGFVGAFAGATFLSSLPGDEAKPWVAGLLLALGAAGLLLPDAWTLFPFGPEDPRWSASHARWGAVLAGAAVLVLVASRDPAARGLLARRPPRTPERGCAHAVPADKRMPPAQPGSERRTPRQPFTTSISSTSTHLPAEPEGRGS